ncbi:hypothetical protein IE81DRAFT_326654 [Ceraceosorus guamensis]|uniref:Uncharacterized protein n=1 Tax=Ceraceosorus guamensis TaxID=1522189 RepID=A0A316VPX2_9BASI|nr:hypothetical protein IE81DRAFT_326654 [Ceraceosorus guamensis]PWN39334.1 hypothetical protein IE81DRAFT_326654 [Ceraceosorus guamensis]
MSRARHGARGTGRLHATLPPCHRGAAAFAFTPLFCYLASAGKRLFAGIIKHGGEACSSRLSPSVYYVRHDCVVKIETELRHPATGMP